MHWTSLVDIFEDPEDVELATLEQLSSAIEINVFIPKFLTPATPEWIFHMVLDPC